MQTYRLKWGVVLMVILELSVLTGLLSSAEAVLTIRSAAVVNGVAVVEGGNAPRAAPISWEGTRVTQANNGGNFAFQGVVPADCVGRLEDGVPADAVYVALANCAPVSSAPAPVPQTGQTTCWQVGDGQISCDEPEGIGQDGDIQAGVAWPTPRFTDRGNGTVRDNLTGLLWLKDADCFGPSRTWPQALTDANTLASGMCGLTDGSRPGDWHLPNIHELRSLIDYNQADPVLPAGHPFTNVFFASGSNSAVYWTSTSQILPAPPWSQRWTVNFSNALTFGFGLDNNFRGAVWPVRGGD
jgi:hypothetical protein